jgi:hypothetical protein
MNRHTENKSNLRTALLLHHQDNNSLQPSLLLHRSHRVEILHNSEFVIYLWKNMVFSKTRYCGRVGLLVS